MAAQRLASRVAAEPGQLLDEERGLHLKVAQECVDPLIAARIQAAHDDSAVLEKAELLARTAGAQPQKATETVRVALLGGSSVTVKTPYFLRRPRRRGRRKAGRGKSGNGVYPILAVLGIHFRVSPALASEVARLVAQGTIEEAQENLAVRGVRVGVKRIRALTHKLAVRGLCYRQWCVARAAAGSRSPCSGSLRGKRLGIAIDGGRLRVRVPTKRGRPRKSGRRGFEGVWREPKVLVVYELDNNGRKKRRGFVRYEATMRDCRGLLEILKGLLVEIGAHEADLWVILGDGAEWIWNGAAALARAVGFQPDKVVHVVDFYHAVERLHEVAGAVKRWSPADRAAWVKRMKRHLRRGETDQIVAERSILCKGRGARKLRTLLGYFETHKQRMRYAYFSKSGIPLGSGVVESGVRRIVNLRLKGNGIFWLIENAEAVLHLRCQLLSGRWNDFVRQILQPEGVWDAQSPVKSARKKAS